MGLAARCPLRAPLALHQRTDRGGEGLVLGSPEPDLPGLPLPFTDKTRGGEKKTAPALNHTFWVRRSLWAPMERGDQGLLWKDSEWVVRI